MRPLKFYQLHFQVRKNISTSKISKAFKSWAADPAFWEDRPRSLLYVRLNPLTTTWESEGSMGWLSRVPTASQPTTSTALPSQAHAFLQTAYSIQGDQVPLQGWEMQLGGLQAQLSPITNQEQAIF